jgi:hypothetical protein
VVGRLSRQLDFEAREALVLTAIRVGLWFAAALALLWSPLNRADSIPPFRAYGPLTDLVFGAFAQWDSVWFIHIAEHGYDSEQATAFFPLYPLAVHGLAVIVRSTLVAGVLVSLASGAVAAAAIAKIARAALGGRVARDAVLFVGLYPIAYVFTAVYSDGLFLALAASSFLAALRRRAVLAGILGGLAVATRLIGLALVPALLVFLWPRRRSVRECARLLPVAFLPAALGLYALYLHFHLGDAFAFAHAQSVYWNRQTPPLGPLSGLWDSLTAGWHGGLELLRHLPRAQGYPGGFVDRDQWAAWNVVHLLLLLAAVWLTWVAWRRLGPAFGLYSAMSIVIVLTSPADLVPLVSLPRFLLGDFPLFMALASVTENRPRARQALLMVFTALAAVAAVAFSRKVWVA